MTRSKDFDFAQLNLTSFLKDLIAHAKETIHMFSKFLADEVKSQLFELRDKLDVKHFRCPRERKTHSFVFCFSPGI